MMAGRLFPAVLAVLLLSSGVGAVTPAPAGGAPIAGSAASEGGGTRAAVDSAGTSVEGEAHPLQSGEDHWQGRHLRFNGSRIVGDPGSAPADERTFGVWSVSDDGRVDTRMSTFTVGPDGVARIPTDILSGRFVVRYDGDPVYVEGGVGYRSSPPDGTAVTTNTSAWTVTAQTLSVGISEDTVYNGQRTRFAFESNRENYTVAVSAEGVTFEDLTRLFPPEMWAPNHDARRVEDALVLSIPGDAEYALNVSGLRAGVYVLRFDVTDTTGSAKAGLEVRRPPPDRRFLDVEWTEQTGDVLSATVACDHCFLMVGGRDQGVFDIVELNDTNGDGRIPLRINTRYAGMNPGYQDVPETVDQYVAVEDSADRLPTGENLTPPGVRSAYGLGEVRSDFGVPPQGRSEPLPPGTYDLTIASTKYVDARITSNEDYPVRRYSIRDGKHVQTVRLTEASVERLETGVAPGDVGGRMSLAEVEAKRTRSDRVAVGDRLIVTVGASGVFGHLLAVHDNDLGGVVGNGNEGINLTVRETSRANPNLIDLAGANAQLLVDPEDDRFHVVVRTRSIRAGRPIEPGETYRVTFSLSGEQGYPYLPDGERRSFSREIRIVAPDADVEAQVGADGRVTFSGRTTVAPGTVLAVSASARGSSSWRRATGVVAGPNRTWQGTIDFSDAPTDEFVVNVSYRGREIAGIDRLDLPGRSPTTATGTPVAGTPTTSRTAPPGSRTATAAATATGVASGPAGNGTAGTPSSEGSGPAAERSGGGAAFAPAIPAVGGALSIAVPSVSGIGLLAIVVLRLVG